MIRMSNCEIPEAKCMDSRNINAYKKILDIAKKNPLLGGMLPYSDNEIKIAEDALDKYRQDCERCARTGKNDKDCMDVARTNFSRNMPSLKNNVYPWKNYEWDYSNHIANQYSTKALPTDRSGSLKGIIKNANNIVRSLDGFVFDPSPNRLSSSYGTDINSDYPVYECKNDPVCNTIEKLKRNKQSRPTDDNFIKQFSINGENSSSYYYKVGTCPRPDISSMNDCENKGYKWTPSTIDVGGGYCTQPRYMYIDNSAKPFFNGSKGKGLIPSITNDIVDIMPDKLLNSLLGQSTTGVQIDTCPNIENFISNNQYTGIYVALFVGLGLIYISKKMIK
jgi:hypothetical protein